MNTRALTKSTTWEFCTSCHLKAFGSNVFKTKPMHSTQISIVDVIGKVQLECTYWQFNPNADSGQKKCKMCKIWTNIKGFQWTLVRERVWNQNIIYSWKLKHFGKFEI